MILKQCTVILFTTFLLAHVGCSIDPGGGQGGGDAGSEDASQDPDATADDAGDAGQGGGGSGGGGLCDPVCGAGEVCCTDSHGHFPKCVAGPTCP